MAAFIENYVTGCNICQRYKHAQCRGSLHFLSACHVVRATLPAFPRPLMRSPAFPALCDALYFLFRLNAALGHNLGLGITPQRVTIKPHSVL